MAPLGCAFALAALVLAPVKAFQGSTDICPRFPRTSLAAKSFTPRELYIQRKIAALKREGRLKKNKDELDDDDDDADALYASKIQKKLGKVKSKMLGYETSADDEVEEELKLEETEEVVMGSRVARIGALPRAVEQLESPVVVSSANQKKPLIDPSLFEDSDDDEEDDVLSDDELVELVAEKFAEKRRVQESRDQQVAQVEQSRERVVQIRIEAQDNGKNSTVQLKQITTGIGGSWDKNATSEVEMYKPKSGSWGAFPRPRDISKAYGGGRRVGPGYSNEVAAAESTEETRERLRRYREKMGIIVQSEIDHAEEIDQALKIASYAMQRGVYSTAVSALEKVSRYCSSNSKVGGKVFLELAMAYEANGRSEEAILVYRTLSNCLMEDIKYDAKRLLYALEAMEFMRNEVGSKAFSRQKVKNTFIDTTGLANIAQNFDDVYNTAWIDLDSGYYKKLTESVVRSAREARQILLKATAAGEVDRQRIVQALRSLARRFDNALEEELGRAPKAVEDEMEEEESVAFIDGKPIRASRRRKEGQLEASLRDLDEFTLTNAEEMVGYLSGEWRLQLLADKQGSGVKFFDSTPSWQNIDMDSASFTSKGTTGFLNVEQSGHVGFDKKRRILTRQDVQVKGSGGVFAGLFGDTSSGVAGAVSCPQQVMSVDSLLLVTRREPSSDSKDNGKNFFAVWRRIDNNPFIDERRFMTEMNR